MQQKLIKTTEILLCLSAGLFVAFDVGTGKTAKSFGHAATFFSASLAAATIAWIVQDSLNQD